MQTTIKISKETRNLLRQRGFKGQTYDSLVRELLKLDAEGSE